MKFERHNSAVLSLRMRSKNADTMSLMLMSDIHFDSSLCDLVLFEKHLKLAEELQAPVLIAGDFFDAMQGRDDPRRSIEDLKAEYKVASYFDAIVQDASAYLRKFKIPFYILAMGNHETSVLNKINTNLTERLAYDLRLHGQSAEDMGYWGYIRVVFDYGKGQARSSKLLYYHHGISTSAPVTKGVIQVARQGAYLQSPDFVLNGHNHESYSVPLQVERMNQRTMVLKTETVWYLRTPGYKKSPADAMSMRGYGAERHRAPTPRGCMVLDLQYSHSKNDSVETQIRQLIT